MSEAVVRECLRCKKERVIDMTGNSGWFCKACVRAQKYKAINRRTKKGSK